MTDSHVIDTLPAEVLQAVLDVDLDQLGGEDGLLVREFLDRIGGAENARLAIEMLAEIEADEF